MMSRRVASRASSSDTPPAALPLQLREKVESSVWRTAPYRNAINAGGTFAEIVNERRVERANGCNKRASERSRHAQQL